ncbi:hypothetical protein DPMN_122850 [Dreissena polymorpha]|uniref:Uncharacterized protein n=1 Tax=Dreissena polymorpha TaxID=45954 RepID=A0A9D4JUU5_DREPO|nr:hypothetical protein DPMN_122850 [Dreissena polymorpha]
MNDIVMARTSLFRPPASPPARQPASQPASQPARIRQSNNQFFPSENLVKNVTDINFAVKQFIYAKKDINKSSAVDNISSLLLNSA